MTRRFGIQGWWIGLLVLVVGLIALPFGGLFLYGLFLPAAYEVSATATIDRSPAVLYPTLSEPLDQVRWRPGVQSASLEPSIDGDPVVALKSGEVTLTLRRTEASPDARVVWTVVPSRKHAFDGSWTWTLEPEGSGTRVTVVEQGRIESPLGRALTHALVGLDVYVRGSIQALARFHDTTAVED